MAGGRNAAIIGTGSVIPPRIVTNKDLEKYIQTSDEWIRERTGIHERRVVEDDIAASDIATQAGLLAMEKAGVSAEDLDLIIVSTVTPDMAFPSTACLVQNNIGAKNAAAFDLEAACSGFSYGMTIAKQFIETGTYTYILVIGVDILSKITNWRDRHTCILFGDGAGAAVLGPVNKGEGILATCLGADGSGGHVLKLPAGGSRMPASHETVEKKLHYIDMDGSEVFKFAVRIMASTTKEVLKKANISLEDIDLLIPHQANIRIIDGAIKRLGIDRDKVFINLHKYGNTSSASIPVALDEAIAEGRVKKGQIIVLAGFGAGLTWGSSVMKWV
ncbi:MAG TPA: ketoacyl-ACP synthase III [Clostridiales bacterium]|nr:ketoacyl-ACP synthase III [Clostridiales bacterium]